MKITTLNVSYETVMKHICTHQLDTLTNSTNCLQCFDAVGWAAGRAYGL